MFLLAEVRTEAVIQALKNYHQGKLPVPMPSKRMSTIQTPPDVHHQQKNSECTVFDSSCPVWGGGGRQQESGGSNYT